MANAFTGVGGSRWKYTEGEVPEWYREFVREQAEAESPIRIPNRTLHSAVFVIRELLNYARSSIDIVTGELPNMIFDNFSDILEAKAKRGVRSRLLVWDEQPVEENCHALSAAKRVPEIEVKFKGDRIGGADLPHFLVCDNRAYRIETPHDYDRFSPSANEEDMAVQAEVCFNDPDVANQLRTIFAKVWQQATS